jgi:thymidylate synthase (FAD)
MSKPIVFATSQGTRYLKEPGVVLISRPSVDLSGMADFLDDLNFSGYLNDPTELASGTQLCKTSAQLCYYSYGPQRTKNANAEKYFDNIISSGHHSVLEHANYTFMLYGISRSLTHELVRHRHFSYSQVSQRYISGKMLRFVERPEYQNDEILHKIFEDRIDLVSIEYAAVADHLTHMQKAGETILNAEQKTDLRKKINQAARSCLSNETEAPIVMTGNIRAWRHFLEMRASEHAEIEIRALAMKVFHILQSTEPILFTDYAIETLPDGTSTVRTEYRKV